MIPFYDKSHKLALSFAPVVQKRFHKIHMTRKIFETIKNDPVISLSKLALDFKISRAYASKLKHQLAKNHGSVENAVALSTPYKTNRAVLGMENEMQIATKLDNCITLDIPVSPVELKQVMSLTAQRRRLPGKYIPESYPSINSVKKFMRDYGFRVLKGKLMSTNFESGEQLAYVTAYAELWTKLFDMFPETENTKYIFNLDETLLDLSKGQESKFIVRKGAYSGIKRRCFKNQHFTIVVITCADGSKIPPVLVIPNFPRNANDKQTLKDLCPEGATILASKTTCTTHQLLVEYIQHFNNHVRKTIPQHKKVVLVVDGHPSREARNREWIQKAEELNIIIMVSPSCTSHFLQPNDQQVNHTIKQSVRSAVDPSKKLVNGFENLSILQQQLVECRQAMEEVSSTVVSNSWHETLITPLNFKTFEDRWKEKWAKFKIQAELMLNDSVYEAGISTKRERNLLVHIIRDNERRQAQGTQTQGTAAHNTAAHGTAAHGTAAHGIPVHGTPDQGTQESATGIMGEIDRESLAVSLQQVSSIRRSDTDNDIIEGFLEDLGEVVGLPLKSAFETADSAAKGAIMVSMANCGMRLSDATVRTMGLRKQNFL